MEKLYATLAHIAADSRHRYANFCVASHLYIIIEGCVKMKPNWRKQIDDRISMFDKNNTGQAISVKIKVLNGCFHREHSPHAYQIIDQYLMNLNKKEFDFIEHESGPEIIAFVNSVTAIINFISAVIKAKVEGMRKGDRHDNPVEVILRRTESENEFIEEVIIKAHDVEKVNDLLIKNALLGSRFLSKPKRKKK